MGAETARSMAESGTHETNRVGRFTLLERLAVGGMAEVFLACERGAHGFERLVVIKKMLPHLQQDDSFVQMFLHEARIAARINHPNVVQILELGESGDDKFIAMEYIDGSTLRELIVAADRRKIFVPVQVAVDLISQALAAAEAVHELKDPLGNPLNLVHRDLSPHNLMVTTTGHVKLLDFGIVKSDGGERTRTGILKGKLSYMAPEQARQEDIDRRADVYAVGVCLWELLAGTRMLGGKNELAIMQAVVQGDLPELAGFRRDVPERIHMVIRKALAKDPAQRWESADAMRRGLNEALLSEGLLLDGDLTREFIRDMLGEKHEQRKVAAARALEASYSRIDVRGDPITSPSMGDRTRSTTMVTGVAGYKVAATVGAIAVTGGAGVLAAAVVFLVAVLVYQGREVSEVDTYVRPSGEPVRLVFAPTVDAGILMQELEPLRRHLEGGLKRPLDFEVADTYADASEALVSGEVDFASLPPYLVVKTRLREPKIEVLAVKQFAGSTGTDGVLIVPESSPHTRVEQLKGARICYTDPDSTTGWLLPRATLRRAGIDPDKDLAEQHFSGNHLQVIRDVLSGRCDVGGVYGGAFTSASQADIPVALTRQLAITGRTPHDAICAGPNTPPELVESLQAALLGFDPQQVAGVKHLGAVEQLSGFIAPDKEAYIALQQAVEAEAKQNAK